MKKLPVLAFLFSLLRPLPVFAQCAPVSARIWESGDDTTQVWVNGSYLGSKDYCNLSSGCSPDSLCFPLPLDKLTGAQVCVAVQTTNVNPVMVFSSWELEVDCSGNKPFVVVSENPARSGISLYWDPTGGSSCGLGHPPPVDGQGNNWTDLAYNPASNPFTLTGEAVTANTWSCAHIKNAFTGIVIPYISYNASAAGSGPTNACGVLYWRQIAKLPVWIYAPTPAAVFTSTPTCAWTALPAPVPTLTPTFTPLPFFTFTPLPTPRPTRTWTPIPPRQPIQVPTHTRRLRLKPTPTFAWLPPTPTWTYLPLPTWTPLPRPRTQKPTPIPTWLPPLVKAQAIFFQTPPVEVYVTFEDGPGRYQLQVVDAGGNPLEMIFDKQIVAEGDNWATWDGKDGRGQEVAVGQYFIVFYKDGQPLRSISVYRSRTNP